MKFISTPCLLVALIASLAEAHTRFTALYVNGVSQGDGTCVRMNMDASKATFPIDDITSNDMACGVGGLTAVNRTCPIKAGDTVSFKFRSYPDGEFPGSIVYAHSGPCAVYMKQMSTATPSDTFPDTSPAGDGWFKIMYDDYDGSQWCVNRLNMSSEGVISAVIPSDLVSGYYLLRPEVLALHFAASKGDPQFYPGCAQVYISGGSGTAAPETASIPGYVNYQMPAMKYNLYSQPLSLPYPAYGPALYKANSMGTGTSSISTSAASTTSSSSTPTSTPSNSGNSKLCGRSDEDLSDTQSTPFKPRLDTKNLDLISTTDIQKIFSCPTGTILEIANWCGAEVPAYTDTDSGAMTNCWAASKQCWDTAQDCWHSFTPAVNNQPGYGCQLMNKRCTDIGDACTAKVMSGPPNMGQVLTPAKDVLTDFGIM